MPVPKFDDLFNPLLKAFHSLGGSASIAELEERTSEILKLSDEEKEEVQRGKLSKLEYRLAWARNYLKNYGLLENSSRGVWALTEKGRKTKIVDKDVVKKFIQIKFRDTSSVEEEVDEGRGPGRNRKLWNEELFEELLKIKPDAFERLCQRVLRESGFIQVEVLGRSGDGGIDGKGILRVGLLSFHVIFQCKRYQGSVASKHIREFQGTMVGRAEKGLFITTGTYTRDAKLEAVRTGAPSIDLIDGEQLVTKMKELGLGLEITMEENIRVNKDWFKSI
jgi:restriction system protein